MLKLKKRYHDRIFPDILAIYVKRPTTKPDNFVQFPILLSPQTINRVRIDSRPVFLDDRTQGPVPYGLPLKVWIIVSNKSGLVSATCFKGFSNWSAERGPQVTPSFSSPKGTHFRCCLSRTRHNVVDQRRRYPSVYMTGAENAPIWRNHEILAE